MYRGELTLQYILLGVICIQVGLLKKVTSFWVQCSKRDSLFLSVCMPQRVSPSTKGCCCPLIFWLSVHVRSAVSDCMAQGRRCLTVCLWIQLSTVASEQIDWFAGSAEVMELFLGCSTHIHKHLITSYACTVCVHLLATRLYSDSWNEKTTQGHFWG